MDIGRSWSFLEQILTVQPGYHHMFDMPQGMKRLLDNLFQIHPQHTSPSQVQWTIVQPCQELREAVLFLGTPGMCELLEEWLHEMLLQYLCKQISPVFWKHFDTTSSGTEESEANAEAFSAAFGFLYDVYSNYFQVALKRLRWLHLLAASAPIAAPSTSAFTPVRSNKPFSTAKVVMTGEMEKKAGLSPSLGATKGDKSSRIETGGRLSVTFEKGTKGDDDMDVVDNSLEMSTSFPGVVGAFASNEKKTAVMDGSYIYGNSAIENSLLSNSLPSAQSEQSINISKNNPAFSAEVFEDSDDFESFIRSPIGGNKKPAGFRMMKYTPLQPASGVSRTLSSNTYGSLGGSSVSTVCGGSLTSTPGTALKQIPGFITPIAQDSPDVFSDMSMEGNLSHPETPSITQNFSAVDTEGILDPLPDPSVVFGSAASSRPVPGGSVRWPSSSQNKVQVMIKAVLFYSFPPHFAAVVKDFYSQAFFIHKSQADGCGWEPGALPPLSTGTVEDDGHVEEEAGLTFEEDLTPRAVENELKRSQARFDEVNRKMDEMDLMELVSGAAVTEVVHSQIEKHIEDECKGNFDTSYLSNLEEWLDQQILGWLNHIYACKQTASQLASVEAFRDRLRHFIYETYARSLIGQFFDIIIDYPDSKPAIMDLCACLEKTDLRSELVSTLKHALESRLLHPGVNTADILTAYIAAIKSLRLLEPAGVILELVCEPVGRYLRSREDTVRCIVASLTDEGSNELISELVNSKPLGDENLEEDGNMCGWEDWMPDPVDADPSTVSKSRRSADILSTLVNIYGSKELFVSEYRALLADRILMQYNYDVERELRYLELLKLRFGEAQLHFCEVMLRDVSESRRINARIHDARKNTQSPEEVTMNAMILSAQFWPTFRDEKIKLPQELQDQMVKYTKMFETHKQNRTLVWKPHLGMMNIELELKDETLNFSVSPVQAAIIMKFQARTKWSVDELSAELEMTPSVLRRKISFWQGQGLLREASADVYHLVEERRGRPQDLVLVDDEEIESAMASAQQQKEEEMQVFWTYIQGMLANLNCLTLERIHSMLRMFAMEEPSSSEVTVQELKTFLDNKVKDQALIFSGGVYRLNK